MPKRPKFWIHRTRRFWFGVCLLVLMVGGTLLMGYYRVDLRHQSLKSLPDDLVETIHRIRLADAGFRLSRAREVIPKGPYTGVGFLPSTWSFETEQEYGFKALPSFKRFKLEGRSGRSITGWNLFIPGTLPIALVMILWPLWMYRAERKEKKLYEGEEPTPEQEG